MPKSKMLPYWRPAQRRARRAPLRQSAVSSPWQVTTFLLSNAGAAAVASGKFNATGQRLVAALPANLDSLDAKVDNLADEINVEVRLRLHHHSLLSSGFATVLPQYGNNAPYPASTKRDNLVDEINVTMRVDHLRVASESYSITQGCSITQDLGVDGLADGINVEVVMDLVWTRIDSY